MYELRYLEQAKTDLIRIKRYIYTASGSNELALKYTEKLRQQCRKLAELPVALFGSFARGTAISLQSDVDILVEFDMTPTFDPSLLAFNRRKRGHPSCVVICST